MMKVTCLLASLLFFLGGVEGQKDFAYYERLRKADVEMANCDQGHPNCQNCLLKSDCVWCVTDESKANDGECRKTEYCLNRQTTCDSSASDDEHDKRAVVVAPTVAQNLTANTNSSTVCDKADCVSCTENNSCFWCHSTGSCNTYFNDTTVNETCSTGSWYKLQCIYPVGVTPCPERTKTCDGCLSDNMCYWCETTDVCRLYPSEDYRPPDCPSDRVYHKDCPYAGSLLVVLLPILSIIFIPVLVYICIWLACCCMRAVGYDPLEEDSDQEPPGDRKHRRGIRLRPGSPSNRTDTLRKKYKLDNP